jgi:hypothetical protein
MKASAQRRLKPQGFGNTTNMPAYQHHGVSDGLKLQARRTCTAVIQSGFTG